MAGLSKFVVVDVTGPSVRTNCSHFQPAQEAMLAIGNPYAMFPDLADQTTLVVIDNDDQIDGNLRSWRGFTPSARWRSQNVMRKAREEERGAEESCENRRS